MISLFLEPLGVKCFAPFLFFKYFLFLVQPLFEIRHYWF